MNVAVGLLYDNNADYLKLFFLGSSFQKNNTDSGATIRLHIKSSVSIQISFAHMNEQNAK